MQQLEERNTPTNTPQVRGVFFCGPELNREETLSVPGAKTSFNNPDVDQPRKGGQNMSVSVYVLSMRDQPLMPTTPRKARLLLQQKKAKVVKRLPFTIQLLYPTGETKQPVTLGIDSGYSTIGFSAITQKRELMSGKVELLKGMKKRLTERRSYRRNRRNRLWYREPRFDHRKRKEGWLAPSIQHKFDTHERFIEKIKSIIPVTKTVVEIATFDMQKMQNPEITGIEYQQGELQGYEVREYILEKWGRKCAYCGKRNIPLEIEHIIPRSRGGSDRVTNLTLSCRKCNLKKGNKTADEFGHPKIQKHAKKSLKEAPFMNVVRKRLAEDIKCEQTYGYVTKYNRTKLNLDKTHTNDAFVIAGGNTHERSRPYTVRQVRRNNRMLQSNRKGFRPLIRRQRYSLQPNDLVKYNGLFYRSQGVHCYGKSIYLIESPGKVISVNSKNVKLICHGKGIQWVEK